MNNKLSTSPNRMEFQKEKYLERCQRELKEVSEDYLEMFDNLKQDKLNKENDPEWRKNNLEYDLRTTDWILEKVRSNNSYAQNLYACLCNNEFRQMEAWQILKDNVWSCSWRYAGGIIADMQQKGDYIDWYCSGIRDTFHNDDPIHDLTPEQLAGLEITKKYVSEGIVTEEIATDLEKLGWLVVNLDDDEKI